MKLDLRKFLKFLANCQPLVTRLQNENLLKFIAIIFSVQFYSTPVLAEDYPENQTPANVESTFTPVVKDEGVPSLFSISGFGTLGAVHSSEDKADYTSTIYKPNGAGHTHKWSADVDSLLGVQLNAAFNPKLTGVLQIIAEQNYDDTYRPHVEWANIKYDFTPDFSITVGRVVMGNFLNSDYRKVGYAYTWVRPPGEVYRLMPVTKNDGITASYKLHVGEATNTVQLLHGGIDIKNIFGGEDKARDQWGIFNTFEYNALTLRLSYLQNNLEVGGVKAIFDGLRQFGPEGVAIADRNECNGKRYKLASVGASYDPGNWFVMSEFGRLNSDCFIGDQTGWYIGGGYRYGKFTPYITFAKSKADSRVNEPGLSLIGLPPFLIGPAIGLNAANNALLNSIPQQTTIAVGTRWDFMKNAALKIQYEHTNLKDESAGPLQNIQPGFKAGGQVNLISTTIDFVF